MTAIDTLLDRNASYAADFNARGVPSPPARKVTVITCMDSRVDPAAMLGLKPGEAHVLRNAGGAVTEDVIRSLAISQRLLGTREVMVIHHTDCGMLTTTDDELKDAIERDTGERPGFAMETFADLDAQARESIRRVRSTPFVPHRDLVRGFVYDVATGRLREVLPQD